MALVTELVMASPPAPVAVPTAADRKRTYNRVRNAEIRDNNRQQSTTSTTVVVPPPPPPFSPHTPLKNPPPIPPPDLRSADIPPRDIREDLFRTGLEKLKAITGRTPDSCRSLIGRWLKAVDDEAIHVIAAIEDAERNKIADPVAWITRSLNGKRGKFNELQRKRGVIDVCDDILESLKKGDDSAGHQTDLLGLPPR